MTPPSGSSTSTHTHTAVGNGRHLIVITLLYFAQGLAQGIVAAGATYLMKKLPLELMTPSYVATLQLPLYCFSLKFLWSPFVDLHYWTPTHHRRCAWVIPTQLVLGIVFAAAAYLSLDEGGLWDHFIAEHHRGSSTLGPFLWLELFLVLLAGAASVQDVAVDAWAVEGLPSHLASVAPTLQTLGLNGGITLVLSFIALTDSYPAVVNLTNFLLLCTGASLGGGLLAAAHAYIGGATTPLLPEDEKKLLQSSVLDGYRVLGGVMLRSTEYHQFVKLLLCFGLISAADGIGSVNLLRSRHVESATVASLDLVARFVSLFNSFWVTHWVRRSGPCDTLKLQTLLDFPLQIMTVLGYFLSVHYWPKDPPTTLVGLFSEPTQLQLYWMFQVVWHCVQGSISVVAGGVLIAAVSHRYKVNRGAVLTLLFATSNACRSLPSTLVMYAYGLAQQALSGVFPRTDGDVPSHYGAVEFIWQTVTVEAYYGLVFVLLLLSFHMRRRWLIPALKYLRISFLQAFPKQRQDIH